MVDRSTYRFMIDLSNGYHQNENILRKLTGGKYYKNLYETWTLKLCIFNSLFDLSPTRFEFKQYYLGSMISEYNIYLEINRKYKIAAYNVPHSYITIK